MLQLPQVLRKSTIKELKIFHARGNHVTLNNLAMRVKTKARRGNILSTHIIKKTGTYTLLQKTGTQTLLKKKKRKKKVKSQCAKFSQQSNFIRHHTQNNEEEMLLFKSENPKFAIDPNLWSGKGHCKTVAISIYSTPQKLSVKPCCFASCLHQ